MKLYSKLAEVYEAMYDTFIDYEEEYHFYNNILSKYHKKSLLEIGSGTGRLAAHFEQNGYDYCGMDLSKEMIAIAHDRLPQSKFMEGDMRNFTLEAPVESVIISGRTISYLLTNEDVLSTFKSIGENLESGGILSFDFIDANRFIPYILDGKIITHHATSNEVEYIRKGQWLLNLKTGMDLIWHSSYHKKVGEEYLKIGDDTANVRTFMKDEIEIFLSINNFEVKEVLERANYAFPTYVVVAEKK